MALKFHSLTFLSPSTSARWVAQKSKTDQYVCRVCSFDHTVSLWASSGKKLLRCTDVEYRNMYLQVYKCNSISQKLNTVPHLVPSASADDEVAISRSQEASTSRDAETMRIRLDQALENEEYIDGLVQCLYDAERVIELSLKERSSSSKMSWFPLAWLGSDKSAWTKALSYQASVYSLLQAAHEILSRGDGRDRDISVVIQRSLLRLSAPLETIIREKFSGKQPEDFEWFWSDQIPVVVTMFVNYFERDPCFKAATMSAKRMPLSSGNGNDIANLVLALRCCVVILKLGPTKLLCSQLFSMIPDKTGSLMDELVGLVPTYEAYHILKGIGLHKEFLIHFGPQAASCGVANDYEADEIVFWVDLVQKQLQRALDREKIWSRLTTSESIEVLEKDLAILGFFVALGRRTRSFLAVNGFEKIDEPIEGFLRYLVGGCILYYPQLSSISSYELYVEVVCEELDWLPFYPGYNSTIKQSQGHNSKSKGPPNAESMSQVLDVCSRWIKVFIKHSKWVENSANVKAARFLSKGYDLVTECREELGLLRDEFPGSKSWKSVEKTESGSGVHSRVKTDTFDKALENVEEALVKLENLLQEMHVSSSHPGKEHLKAACSELEKIRKLKNETEFLEASFRAKAASLQEENDDGESLSSHKQRRLMKSKDKGHGAVVQDRNNRNTDGLWKSIVPLPKKQHVQESSKLTDRTIDRSFGSFGESSADIANEDTDEIHRFELLRSELMELEKRVQRSNTESENGKGIVCTNVVKGTEVLPEKKNENFIGKSLEKMKETGTDVWQGTQLLAIDTAAATGLLRRAIVGDELTEKEMKYLRRTLTDLASVVPIGVLMLLPVTAVGHAAMLAAIQKYFPSLIPSTYGSERLNLLRQLEKMKQINTSTSKPDHNM